LNRVRQSARWIRSLTFDPLPSGEGKKESRPLCKGLHPGIGEEKHGAAVMDCLPAFEDISFDQFWDDWRDRYLDVPALAED
jgi:hypothetical protein